MSIGSKEEITALYVQIQQIYTSFKLIRNEAEGILETSEMPDSQSQLDNVLQSTEEATVAILTHVSAIQEIVGSSSMEAVSQEAVQGHVMQVFEACSFQDISGQRIQKVIARLQTLEEQLMQLSKTASATAQVKEANADALLNGPQLNGKAPDQHEIDQMFNS